MCVQCKSLAGFGSNHGRFLFVLSFPTRTFGAVPTGALLTAGWEGGLCFSLLAVNILNLLIIYSSQFMTLRDLRLLFRFLVFLKRYMIFG